MSENELIEKTDAAISELVINKSQILKAYNYYSGIRDRELFKYLEDNFGIGSPTSVEFTPLVKKHIDLLIGEFLETPIIPKISCKDSLTISNINRDKQLHIASELGKFLQSKLKSAFLQFLGNGQTTDINILKLLEKLKDELDQDFISEYEVAAQNVIQYIIQSRQTDLRTHLRDMLLDLFVGGHCMFRCKPSVGNNNVQVEVLDPLNTFPDRNPESPYIKDSYRIVIRKWMNVHQILNLYGRDLSKEDVSTIKESWEGKGVSYGNYFVTGKPGDRFSPIQEGLDYGVEATQGYPDKTDTYHRDLIPVYEVEWIETDSKFMMHRYSTIRIGEDVYILKKEDEGVIRSIDNPTYCSLSVNGIYFTNRTYKPYSLMLACMNLQDKYDCLNYIRDRLFANSGTVGDIVDVSMLPTWLGADPSERLLKYIGFKKNGIAPIDSAQEGRVMMGLGQSNTWMNGYDDTVKVQAIQAIQLAMDSIEQTVSSITGVFRERLNGIQQHDAVSNIQQGVKNSFTISKQYYQQMDLVIAELLTDALNVAKIVYKNGLTGTLILGDKYLKTFTALPEHFTITDYDIHVVTSSDVVRDMEAIKQLIPEFVKSNVFTPDIILEAITSKSPTELKLKALLAMRKLKEESNQLQQLQQLAELLQQELQKTQQLLQQALSKIEQLNEQKIQIEREKAQAEAQINWYTARTDRDYKVEQNRLDAQKVEIERKQLYDGNPYNDEINFGK